MSTDAQATPPATPYNRATIYADAPPWAKDLIDAIEEHNAAITNVASLAESAIAKAEPFLPEITDFIKRLEKSPIFRMLGGL